VGRLRTPHSWRSFSSLSTAAGASCTVGLRFLTCGLARSWAPYMAGAARRMHRLLPPSPHCHLPLARPAPRFISCATKQWAPLDLKQDVGDIWLHHEGTHGVDHLLSHTAPHQLFPHPFISGQCSPQTFPVTSPLENRGAPLRGGRAHLRLTRATPHYTPSLTAWVVRSDSWQCGDNILTTAASALWPSPSCAGCTGPFISGYYRRDRLPFSY